MPTYRYKNQYGKSMFRASSVDTPMGTRPDGSAIIVKQPGPWEEIKSGSLLTDVADSELVAFKDMFELVTDQEMQAMQAAAAQGAPMELYDLKGVHEPAAAIDAPVTKPAPDAAQVTAAKTANKEVQKLEQEQAQQKAEMDKQLEETRSKAYGESLEKELENQRQQQRQASGRPQAGSPAHAPAAPAPAPEHATPHPTAGHEPEGGARRGR